MVASIVATSTLRVNEIAEQFLTLKKDDLKALGKHLNLDVIKAAMKKAAMTACVACHIKRHT